MAIAGFNYKELAAELAKQAVALVPEDIPMPEKKYIITLINNFCIISGKSLNDDPNIKFDASQATIITQFIGEWAFHKSIDLIRGGIPPQLRDPIMQKLAFAIFEEAKLALIKKLPDEQVVNLVENKVNQVFGAEIQGYVQKGAITPEQAQNVLQQSNIDSMAQKENEVVAKFSNKKILKLVAMAMILKKMPQEKVKAILDSLDPHDVKFIIDHMKVENLENKIDKSIVLESLYDIRRELPEPKEINVEKVMRKLNRAVSLSKPQVIEAVIKQERSNVKNFIYDQKFPTLSVFTPSMLQIISDYLEEKLNDYKEKPSENK
ncbi:hypothetical protein IKQ26_04135 [bacterium]|nr:hypothetical protein [bacterium]